MTRPTLSIIFAATANFLVGCHAPPQPSGPTEIVVRISDRERFFDDAMTVLREHDFQPRRLERDQGLLVAGPTTAGQWFEVWRGDTRGDYNTAEANLHTVRHTVTLRLDPETGSELGASVDAERFRLSLRVDKERLSAVERQVTTTGAALTIFSERVPTVEGYRDPLDATRQWVPRGRNGQLESYLLRRVVEATQTSAEPRDADSAPTTAPVGTAPASSL